MSNNKVRTSVSISEENHEKLINEAKKQKRSVSSMNDYILTMYFVELIKAKS